MAVASAGPYASIVTALVRSHLDYCNAVLSDLPASTLVPESYMLQHVLFWTVGHVTMAVQELHWLPVTERIQYKLFCLMVHQSLLGHMPVCISDLLTSVPTIPAQSALRALLSGDLVVQWTRQRIGDKAFSVATLQTWNRLPRELRLLRSTTTFRCQLKTFLFQSAPVYVHRDTD